MQNRFLVDCIVGPCELSRVSKHHDKGTYHVFQQRGKPQDTRLFTSAQLKLSVRLQKVDPAFCRESFPSHPRAPTSFTGHQKLTSWGPQSVGVADRQLGTCFTRSRQPRVARRLWPRAQSESVRPAAAASSAPLNPPWPIPPTERRRIPCSTRAATDVACSPGATRASGQRRCARPRFGGRTRTRTGRATDHLAPSLCLRARPRIGQG